ncbi:hypothetical protein [Polaribacter sp. 20A6]|uniref:hypothetical protein n=1 Tax=Polaribacter sp. 20A6 TaxID=2687289 RepID=UPI0013FE436A|nr:hypothetical protein [Polaribacter sp. 20A6]
MPYIINHPSTVLSPKRNVKNVTVFYNGGAVPGGYSVAKLKWNGNDVIGIRWNITENEIHDKDKISGKKVCLGEPNSRGHSTWFILPDDLIEKLITGGVLAKDLKKYLDQK